MSQNTHHYDELIALLYTCKGSRTFHKFARDCGVDPGYISRIIHKQIDSFPTPQFLQKLASYAQNGVSYSDLMAACRYIEKERPEQKIANKYSLNHLDDELKEFVSNPDNIEYIYFIFDVYKSKFPKELLSQASVMINYGKPQ
jgi:transcriptional regulator with XRE-family HTH domain